MNNMKDKSPSKEEEQKQASDLSSPSFELTETSKQDYSEVQSLEELIRRANEHFSSSSEEVAESLASAKLEVSQKDTIERALKVK